MNKLIKKIFNNPWIISVFAPFITTGISSVWISKTHNVNIKESLLIIYNFVKNIINYKVTIGTILTFIILIFFLGYIAIYILQKTNSNSFSEHPDWYYDFRTMNYKKWIFKWDYVIYANTYDIKDLKPICSCECELIRKSKIGNTHYGSSVLFCPNCHNVYESPDTEIIKELKSLISYKINKKSDSFRN